MPKASRDTLHVTLPCTSLFPTLFTALHKHSCPKPAMMTFAVPCFNQACWDTVLNDCH